MRHPDELQQIDWRAQIELDNRTFAAIRLVVPILVVDELDNNKNNNKLSDKAKTRARSTLKALYSAFGSDPTSLWTIKKPDEATGGLAADLLLDNPAHR